VADTLSTFTSQLKANKYAAIKVTLAKTHTRDSTQALSKLTPVVGGDRRIINDPPLRHSTMRSLTSPKPTPTTTNATTPNSPLCSPGESRRCPVCERRRMPASPPGGVSHVKSSQRCHENKKWSRAMSIGPVDAAILHLPDSGFTGEMPTSSRHSAWSLSPTAASSSPTRMSTRRRSRPDWMKAAGRRPGRVPDWLGPLAAGIGHANTVRLDPSTLGAVEIKAPRYEDRVRPVPGTSPRPTAKAAARIACSPTTGQSSQPSAVPAAPAHARTTVVDVS
jgi:hypothetical protein